MSIKSSTVQPDVSVITPTYNRRDLLPRTWESLRRQTGADFEWIVVDDGSTDGTDEYIRGLGDARIRYFWQPNLGCNAARQRGEAEVRGRYVVFLDSDDELYAADTLAMMVEAIEATGPEIGVVNFSVVTPEGGGGASWFAANGMILGYEDLVCEGKVRGEALRIFKREALAVAPWDVQYRGHLALRYLEIAKSYRFLFIDRPARIYHMNHGSNLTSAAAAIERAASMARGYEDLIERHRAAWQRFCPCQYGVNLVHAAMYYALDGQSTRAWQLGVEGLLRGGARINAVLLLCSLLLPLPLRRSLFIWRSRRRGRY